MDDSPYLGVTPVASLIPAGGTVTLVEGRTFALSDQNGDMNHHLPHGLFALDARIISTWQLCVNGDQVEPLAVHLDEPYAATYVSRAVALAGQADADILVFRHRHIGLGMRERIEIRNYGLVRTRVVVQLDCDSDFASVFEVKERRAASRGRPPVKVGVDGLELSDPGDSGHRVVVRSSGARVDEGRFVWEVEVDPGATWEACIEVTTLVPGRVLEARFRCGDDEVDSLPGARMTRWRASAPEVDTDHPGLSLALQRCSEDIGALRIFDPDLLPDLPVIAAGAPWFMTVFGRDSLITAWMSMIADAELAQGVLQALARFQGRDVDDRTEEEPGKILHEMRFVSGAAPKLAGGDVYYGSIDATPLFVMLLGELQRWGGDRSVVDGLLPHADRALEWITSFGDVDGDGFVEYARRNDDGLANQGWKDSWDAVRHADGALASGPIALCEVQGYVYAAYLARAHLAREVGDRHAVERWTREASDLRRRFNEAFWLDELGTYAMALDGDKRPVTVAASNVGHCLWTGIVEPARAASVAARLVGSDLFGGWGIRTLSASARAYNPVSYHNGSVWPHDNAITAAGLARYGRVEEAHRVITAQLDVAATYKGRMPELFAGFSRAELPVPASYPTSCSPQAWASASPLLWLRTLLRLDPASTDRVWLAPRLPAAIGRLRVSGVEIGGRRITIDVEGDDVRVEGLDGYQLLTTPRDPLTSLIDGV